MIRRLHSMAGLVFGLVLVFLAGTGGILSLDPGLERMRAQPGGTTVAILAAGVAANHPDIERLERRANGVFIASFATSDGYETVQIDPATGADLGPWETSGVMRWIRGLHRSLSFDDTGRAVAGTAAAVMAGLGVTGVLLLVAALGGWGRLGRRVRSTGANRWHSIVGRAAMAGLTVSALTGVWLSLATFGIIDDGRTDGPVLPETVAGAESAAIETLPALQGVRVDDLRRLTWPAAGDPTDVFGLQTKNGVGYVSQTDGELLVWQGHSTARTLWEWAYLLHTGQGLWWFGLILGVSALTTPVLAATGGWIWWRRRSSRPRIAGTVAMPKAEIVVLAGSEGGATWGFAATLVRALVAAGRSVHLGAMNDAGPMPAAKALIVLTSTHGDGEPPASATRFQERLGRMTRVPVAVLGFGDRNFPAFCGFADSVSAGLARSGWPELLPMTRIDRQSTRDFAIWGRALGQVLDTPLELQHHIVTPGPVSLTLVGRQDFGQMAGAPSAILRFKARQGGRLPRFVAGDLLGVLAPGSDVPRYYSLASGRRDGFAEIAVRRMPEGLCSGHLHGLAPGDEIRAFVRPNPSFRVQRGRAPVILVAAGCGIGPMAGILRNIRPGRPSALYFGIRDPQSDFLYRRETDAMLADGRLSQRIMAFSRIGERNHVQDCLRGNAEELAHQIRAGGQVLVCGSAAMARGVAGAFAEILRPLGLTVAGLKAEGRYLEDAY